MGDCAGIDDCAVVKQQAKDLGEIKELFRGSHDSTIRQEITVTNLAATIGKLDRENREDHKELFNKVNKVTVSNASKVLAKDIVTWVLAIVAILSLAWTIYSTPRGTQHYEHGQSYNQGMGREYAGTSRKFLEGNGQEVWASTPGLLERAGGSGQGGR